MKGYLNRVSLALSLKEHNYRIMQDVQTNAFKINLAVQ